MAKQSFRVNLDRNHPDYEANKTLLEFKFLDLQAACISRGMLFEEVVDSDRLRLESWFCKHFKVKQNKGLLEDFDVWVQKTLMKTGKFQKDDPFIQYKRFSALNENGEVKATNSIMRKAKIKKEAKPKRERDTKFKIFSGTKKAYTYHLAQDLYDKLIHKYDIKQLFKNFSTKLVEKVKAKYPEAQEKSVKIWMTRALKAIHAEKTKTVR